MTQRVFFTARRTFTGRGAAQTDWGVLIDGATIEAVGPAAAIDVGPDVRRVDLGDATLLPGLIDLHSHVLLYPYNRTSWNDQVLHEAEATRVARATVALAATLRAGFTLLRDLGTEGAGYADVGLRAALEQGIIPGPKLIATTRAIVATGSYGPKGFSPDCDCTPIGAQEADGVDALTRVVRDQIRRGADWIKVYADYYWGPGGTARPTFTIDELKLVVDIAESSGRHVAAHASTAEGMRRATLAGVRTIEHGTDGTPEIFALMAEHGVAFCPTIAAYDAISRYRGWNGADPVPSLIAEKRASMHAALAAGVTIANGSDVGVFDHGENARELELLVDYGMSPQAALEAATTVAARVVDFERTLGTLAPGMTADLIAVAGDPTHDITTLRNIQLVIQSGRQVASPPR
jgi:imidazolonepropionase-like amidohydrolase